MKVSFHSRNKNKVQVNLLLNLTNLFQSHAINFEFHADIFNPNAGGLRPVKSSLFLLGRGLLRGLESLGLLLLNTFLAIFLTPDKKPRVCPVKIPLNVLTSASSGSSNVHKNIDILIKDKFKIQKIVKCCPVH